MMDSLEHKMCLVQLETHNRPQGSSKNLFGIFIKKMCLAVDAESFENSPFVTLCILHKRTFCRDTADVVFVLMLIKLLRSEQG